MKLIARLYWRFRIWNKLRQENAYANWLKAVQRESTKERRLLRQASRG